MPLTLSQQIFAGRPSAAGFRSKDRSLGGLLRLRWHVLPWLAALGIALSIGPDIVDLAVLCGTAALLSAVLRDAGNRR